MAQHSTPKRKYTLNLTGQPALAVGLQLVSNGDPYVLFMFVDLQSTYESS